MIQWLEEWWASVKAWITELWTDFTEFLADLPKDILEGLLDALAALIESIPVPDLVQNNSLGDTFALLPSGVQYFLGQSGMVEATAIIASGFAFRMTRKLITLFQW
jgi:hypothetical protein